MSHEHCVKHTIGIVLEVVLLQNGETLARAKLNSSLVGLQVTAYRAQKGRLACAIGADNAVYVSRGEFDIYVFVQNSFAKLNC